MFHHRLKNKESREPGSAPAGRFFPQKGLTFKKLGRFRAKTNTTYHFDACMVSEKERRPAPTEKHEMEQTLFG